MAANAPILGTGPGDAVARGLTGDCQTARVSRLVQNNALTLTASRSFGPTVEKNKIRVCSGRVTIGFGHFGG